MKRKILVPTDLSEASRKAVAQAVTIAKKLEAGLVLLNIANGDSRPTELNEMDLNAEAAKIRKNKGLTCETMVLKGSFIQSVKKFTCENDHCLMVVGTTGIHGIRQRLLGPDILKLVSSVSMPTLVVQEDSPVTDKFSKIVLPVASHKNFRAAVEAVCLFAEAFHSEVHLYSIQKPGYEWPERLVANIEEATKVFESRKIKWKRVREDQTVYSQGYAKQTLNYAKSAKTDAICIMAIPSREYYYFAQADKVFTLFNEHRIPILCAGGGHDEA